MEIIRFSIKYIDKKYTAESYQMYYDFVTRKQTGIAKRQPTENL